MYMLIFSKNIWYYRKKCLNKVFDILSMNDKNNRVCNLFIEKVGYSTPRVAV
jgi:hypothetical protein